MSHWRGVCGHIKHVLLILCGVSSVSSTALHQQCALTACMLCLWSYVGVLQYSVHYQLMSYSTAVLIQLIITALSSFINSLIPAKITRPATRTMKVSPAVSHVAMKRDTCDMASSPRLPSRTESVMANDEDEEKWQHSMNTLSLSTNYRQKQHHNRGVFSLRQYRSGDSSGTTSVQLTPARLVYRDNMMTRGASSPLTRPAHCSSWIAGDFWQRRSTPDSACHTASRTSSSQSSGFIDTHRAATITADDSVSVISSCLADCTALPPEDHHAWTPSSSPSVCSHRWSPGCQSVTSTCTLDTRVAAAAADWRHFLTALVLGFSLAFNVFIAVYLTSVR